MRNIILKSAIALALGLPLVASAESSFNTGAGTITTSARVDFTITIPKFVSLQVGAAGAGINLVTFTPTAAQLAAGGSVAAASGGAVTAQVRGNNGVVTLTSAAAPNLTNGATGSIPYTEITTTPSALTSAIALPAPALTAAGSTAAALAITGKVTNQDATWTYSYNNSTVYEAGTYGGVNVLGGRVTYTASMP
jgi:hypothetical protein